MDNSSCLSQKKVKQRIKCFQCGKKTIQQSPEKYQQYFFCENCGIMWYVTETGEQDG